MRIKMRVFATLRDELGWKEKELEVKDNLTLRELLEEIPKLKELIFDDGEIHEHYRVYINGRYIDFAGGLDRVIEEGDEITIFPALAGG
jgi:molybdopterin synthase sulfur carrier subunit